MLRITTPFLQDFILDGDVVNSGLPVRSLQYENGTSLIKTTIVTIDGCYAIAMQISGDHDMPVTIDLDESGWALNFIIDGQLHIQQGDAAEKLSIKEGHYHQLVLLSSKKLCIKLTANVQLLTFYLPPLGIGKLLCTEYEPWLQEGNEWLKPKPITFAMNEIITLLALNTDKKMPSPVYLMAKVLELLFIGMEQYREDKPAGSKFANEDDLAKLEQAKALINENLQTPFSIIELARKVGLNDFKLKKGFKEVFGTTVFGYLFELRMEKAKQLLTLRDHSVSLVAHQVGYKNAHHFTAAFKRRFGALPSSINKLTGWLLFSIILTS